MPDLDDHAAVKLWGRVIRGYEATSRALQKELRDRFDLSEAEVETLLDLALRPEHFAPMKALAQAASFSTGGFTKIADRLTDRGLTERVHCAKDRRVTYLALTETGTRLADDLTRAVATINRELFIDALGEEKARDVAAAMTTLYHANTDQ